MYEPGEGEEDAASDSGSVLERDPEMGGTGLDRMERMERSGSLRRWFCGGRGKGRRCCGVVMHAALYLLVMLLVVIFLSLGRDVYAWLEKGMSI